MTAMCFLCVTGSRLSFCGPSSLMGQEPTIKSPAGAGRASLQGKVPENILKLTVHVLGAERRDLIAAGLADVRKGTVFRTCAIRA